jgi:hypothetical protein
MERRLEHYLNAGTGNSDTAGQLVVHSTPELEKVLLADAAGKYTGAELEQVLDSGASIHLTGNYDLLFNIETTKRTVTLILADGHRIEVTTFGTMMVTDTMYLTNVGYVPKMRTTLVSVSEIMKGDFSVVFKGDNATIMTPVNEEVTSWRKEGGLFIAQLPKKSIPPSTWAKKGVKFTFHIWNKVKKGDLGDGLPPPPPPSPPAGTRRKITKKDPKNKPIVTTTKTPPNKPASKPPTTSTPAATPAATTDTSTASTAGAVPPPTPATAFYIHSHHKRKQFG